MTFLSSGGKDIISTSETPPPILSIYLLVRLRDFALRASLLLRSNDRSGGGGETLVTVLLLYSSSVPPLAPSALPAPSML